jgi:non-heme chloroperoxidase
MTATTMRDAAAVSAGVKRAALSTGVTLEYVEQGAGAPVVLLHGVTDSWRSFDPLLAALPPTVHAYAVTQRGHGGSDKPAAGYRYADFAADVVAFLDAVGVPKAVIVGHSMGAVVALRVACTAPERVAGLFLLGAVPTWAEHSELQSLWDAAIGTFADPIDRGFVHEFQASTVARPLDEAWLDVFVAESLKAPARVWRAAFAELLHGDFSAELSNITAPTVVLWGDRDGLARRAERDALTAALPGAQVVDDTGGGHAIHWETPARVAGDIVRFVAGLPAATSTQK